MPNPPNPFTHPALVETAKFIGRRNEIDRILGRLSSLTCGSVALSGERRIGKTSLLRYLESPQARKGWVDTEAQPLFIYQDCGAISPFTAVNFWQTILKRLRRQLRRQKAPGEVLEAIQELLDTPEITVQDIEFLLDDLHEANLRLVLLLDEFEWCVRTDVKNMATTRDFLGGLRSLLNYVPRVLSLVIATCRPLNEVCRRIRFMGSPFYNTMDFVLLRPFALDEADRLLEHLLAGTDVTFSTPQQAYIYDLAGTHPLLLQIAAGLVFEVKVKGSDDLHDIFPLRQQFRERVAHHFEDLWQGSLSREREILTRLAQDRDDAVTDLVAWTDEWERLLKRGLIKREDGVYRLFSSVFWEWLIDNLYRLEELHPPDSPRLADLNRQFQAHQRRVNILKNKEAYMGFNTPPHILMEIEDIEAKIDELSVRITEGSS